MKKKVSTSRRLDGSLERLTATLEGLDAGFVEVVKRLPPREDPPPLPHYWLHLEMVERYKVLSQVDIGEGARVLEVGSGPHAIATAVIAHRVGEAGVVVSAELERWTHFDEILSLVGLRSRVRPVACDARQLPLQADSFDLAAIVHGIRSLHDQRTMVLVLREMMRTAPRVLIAETLPVAETEAQEAHLEMYNLREEIFEARIGKKDDLHYPPLGELERLVTTAGGLIADSRSIRVDQPHFLAYLPRGYVEKIEDREKRESLLDRWDRAYRKLSVCGEEHPPVGLVLALRDRSS